MLSMQEYKEYVHHMNKWKHNFIIKLLKQKIKF